ncbi:MAG: hypothetical protein LBQ93_06610 [Treponema sp.]|jgi:hypothetical protein|nr:hypothetical protein [Treponema sp.]
MSGKKPERSGRFRFADFMIILVFFSIAGLFIYMLADDLMPVINFQESVFFDRLVMEAPPAMYIPPEIPEINSDPIVVGEPPSPVTAPVSPSPPLAARPPAASSPAAVVPSLPQLLPSPRNLQPAAGSNFSLEELRSGGKIVFSWQAVQGANAYIFYLYQQTESKQQLVLVRANIVYTPQYTMGNIRIRDKGIFIWRVEAIYIGRSNRIERSGRQGESSFIVF